MTKLINHYQKLLLCFIIIYVFSSPTGALKCYICEFNINHCKDPNCYNNPDICSSGQFTSFLVPMQECPRNCMMKAVTNPAGIVLKWKRLCAPASDLTYGFRCRIDYVFGARIEQCTCDKDFCNGATGLNQKQSNWILSVTVILLFYYHFYY